MDLRRRKNQPFDGSTRPDIRIKIFSLKVGRYKHHTDPNVQVGEDGCDHMSPQTQCKHPTCWSMWSVSYHYTNQEHGVGEEVCELHYAHQHYKLPGVKHQVRRCLINLFFSLFKGWGPIAFLLHFHFCISKKSKSTCPFWVQGYTLKLLQK